LNNEGWDVAKALADKGVAANSTVRTGRPWLRHVPEDDDQHRLVRCLCALAGHAWLSEKGLTA
jgi:hypothetical protein